jgi:hypothetical protein
MNDSLIVSESMAAEGVSGERYAKKILQVAEKCETEEDIKIAVQGILQDALKALGIDIEAKYERAVFNSKRADALYPTIIIEYKKPISRLSVLYGKRKVLAK